jgi:hypothetical protein
MKSYVHTGLIAYAMLLAILSLLAALVIPAFAADVIDVKRDNEKTVYSIGSNDARRYEEAEEKARAWDMLNNMAPIVDGRQMRPGVPPRGTPVPQTGR